jgi:hypothetical protein
MEKPLLKGSSCLQHHGVTVKLVALTAAPPGVVMAILAVFAPVGRVAVTCVSDCTMNVGALTPL